MANIYFFDFVSENLVVVSIYGDQLLMSEYNGVCVSLSKMTVLLSHPCNFRTIFSLMPLAEYV